MEIRAVTALGPGEASALPGCFQAWEGGRLVGSLSLVVPLAHTAEVSAFILPEYRRRGVFSALLRRAEDVCRARGAARVLFSCDGKSPDGRAVAEHWGLALDHRECVLVLRGPRPALPADPALKRMGPEDVEAVAALTGAAFGNPAAEEKAMAESTLTDPARQCWGLWEGEALAAVASVGPAAEGLSIHSVAVDPVRQGRGMGRRLMAALLGVLPREKNLVVEVEEENCRARALYQGFGFKESRRQDYFVRDL